MGARPRPQAERCAGSVPQVVSQGPEQSATGSIRVAAQLTTELASLRTEGQVEGRARRGSRSVLRWGEVRSDPRSVNIRSRLEGGGSEIAADETTAPGQETRGCEEKEELQSRRESVEAARDGRSSSRAVPSRLGQARRWRRAGRTLLDGLLDSRDSLAWGGRGRSRAAADSAWSRCGLCGLWSLWLLLRGG